MMSNASVPVRGDRLATGNVSVAAAGPLYPGLLGEAWPELAESVRRAHCTGSEICATGIFRVQAPSRWLGRQAVRWLRLPPAAEATAVNLSVTPEGLGETWQRKFAGTPFVTWQFRNRAGELVERFAGFQLRMQLRAEDGGLVYEQVGAALFRGWLPLPGFLSPRVAAREMPEGPDAVRVSVRVTLPLVGTLLSYEGRLTVPSAISNDRLRPNDGDKEGRRPAALSPEGAPRTPQFMPNRTLDSEGL